MWVVELFLLVTAERPVSSADARSECQCNHLGDDTDFTDGLDPRQSLGRWCGDLHEVPLSSGL